MEESRKSGRTTRIVDEAIQKLFEEGSVIIKDHYGSEAADRLALNILLRRLYIEHGCSVAEVENTKSGILVVLKK